MSYLLLIRSIVKTGKGAAVRFPAPSMTPAFRTSRAARCREGVVGLRARYADAGGVRVRSCQFAMPIRHHEMTVRH